jgi:regulatory protein
MPGPDRPAASPGAGNADSSPIAGSLFSPDTDERQRAFDVAWKALGRRDRTELELQQAFLKARVEPGLAGEVLEELRAGGYVDDASYARRFAEDRRNLDGWGTGRIERRLAALGVSREHIAAAVQGGDHDDLTAALALLERRFPQPPTTPRERDRALGHLLRKGYELELAHDALRRHAGMALDN